MGKKARNKKAKEVNGVLGNSPQTPHPKQLHTLDLEGIALVQKSNADYLKAHYEITKVQMKQLQKERGLYVGHKLVADKNYHMTWLGNNHSGGGGQGGNSIFGNNGALFPSFDSLRRCGELPGKCRIQVEENFTEAQAWIDKIWDGECVYHVHDGADYNRKNNLDNPNSKPNEVCCSEICVTTTDDETLLVCRGFVSGGTWYRIHPALEQGLVNSTLDRDLLVTRMMHHFLRQYAYMIPNHLLQQYLGGPWERSLTSKKYKEEYLDWQILRADLTLNLPNIMSFDDDDDDELACAIKGRLMCVGGALAALQRWEQAARLYVELGETFQNCQHVYGLAGRSFQFAGLHEDALELYVRQLSRLLLLMEVEQQQAAGTAIIDQEPYKEILGSMMFVHHALFEASLSRPSNPKTYTIVIKQDTRLAVAYVALLHAAGFAAGEADPETVRSFFCIPEFFDVRSYLKPKVRKPQTARRAILQLMRSGSVVRYKENLDGLVEKSCVLPLAPRFDTESSEDLRNFLSAGAAKSAQALGKNDHTDTVRRCGYCQKWGDPSKLGKCPCGKMYYCNKTCQQADWKRHKQSCSSLRKTNTEGNHQSNKNKEEGTYRSSDFSLCSACSNPIEKGSVQSCPCGQRPYCGKDCQVSDWKDHKKMCPWQLARKQNKSSTA